MQKIYRIRIQGHLDPAWAEEVAGLTITHAPDGSSVLQGPIPDQAALRGVLNRLGDLGLPLLEVTLVEEKSRS